MRRLDRPKRAIVLTSKRPRRIMETGKSQEDRHQGDPNARSGGSKRRKIESTRPVEDVRSAWKSSLCPDDRGKRRRMPHKGSSGRRKMGESRQQDNAGGAVCEEPFYEVGDREIAVGELQSESRALGEETQALTGGPGVASERSTRTGGIPILGPAKYPI